MTVPPTCKKLAMGIVACGLLAPSLWSAPVAAQTTQNKPGEQAANGAFFRPSPAAAVRNAIRIQQRAIRKESGKKKLLSDLPVTAVARRRNQAPGLRSEQLNDGVIVLTNQPKTNSKKPGAMRQAAGERATLIAEPLGGDTTHKLELQRVIEESSVIVPLRPLPSMAALAKRAPDPGEDDLGLDIALAGLVALGLAFLGISAWQRSQQI